MNRQTVMQKQDEGQRCQDSRRPEKPWSIQELSKPSPEGMSRCPRKGAEACSQRQMGTESNGEVVFPEVSWR